jgi:hypothetical protein
MTSYSNQQVQVQPHLLLCLLQPKEVKNHQQRSRKGSLNRSIPNPKDLMVMLVKGTITTQKNPLRGRKNRQRKLPLQRRPTKQMWFSITGKVKLKYN